MRLILWTALFLASFLAEAALLPNVVGAAVPSVSTFIVWSASLRGFWPGLALVGFAGIVRDAAAPLAEGGRYTLFFLGVFGAMRSFLAVSAWDDPWRRIGALALGMAVAPLVWLLAPAAARLLLGAALPPVAWSDAADRLFFREAAAALVWLGGFSWLAVRASSRERARRLQHL